MSAALQLRPKQPEREPCKEIPKAPQEFLDYWFFPTGSWWVYKLDSSADIYDTVRGTSKSFYTPPSDYHVQREIPPCMTEYVQHLIHSDTLFFTYQRRGSNLITAGEMLYTIYYKNKNLWQLIHTAHALNLTNFGTIYMHPSTIGAEYNGGIGRNYFKGIDTFTSPFLGTLDSTIFITNDVTSNIIGKHFKKLYITKGIGLVRIEYINGGIWNLVKYHIIK